MHKGKQVRDWLATHPRFVCHFVPVHCSWMNQVEQWFSILQRKRLRISDFSSLDHLAQRVNFGNKLVISLQLRCRKHLSFFSLGSHSLGKWKRE
jgi:transposase